MSSDSTEQNDSENVEPQNEVVEETPAVSTATSEENSSTPSSESSSEGESFSCLECGSDFIFSKEQQDKYAARGFQRPKRCPECREKRRQRTQPNKRKGKKSRRNSPSNKRPQSAPRHSPQESNAREPAELLPAEGSYVAQAESYRQQKNSAPMANENHPPEDSEDFGNSIHYQGPGVDPRFGTARDDQPQFAPWEGAHGFLLTHHEANTKKKPMPRDKKFSKGKRKPAPAKNAPRSKSKSFGKKKRKMHDIVCNDCGIETQVPFKPLPGKPVFCQDCYKKSRAKGSPEARDANPPAEKSSESLGSINENPNPDSSIESSEDSSGI